MLICSLFLSVKLSRQVTRHGKLGVRFKLTNLLDSFPRIPFVRVREEVTDSGFPTAGFLSELSCVSASQPSLSDSLIFRDTNKSHCVPLPLAPEQEITQSHVNGVGVGGGRQGRRWEGEERFHANQLALL